MALDIKKDAEIDQYALEKEAKVLPSTIARYHEAITEQSRVVDNLKFKLAKEEAVARQDARSALTRDGVKPTQAMIDDAVSCLSAILQLRKDVAEEERELAYIKGCLSILDTKRKSIDNLVQLYCRSYFGEIQTDRNSASGKYKEADVKRKASVDYEVMTDEETSHLNNTRRK